jgi:iron complex transport system substrate-binding protein
MIALRFLATIGFALCVAVAPAAARSVTDSAGRTVDVPDHITRVLAAGPPASVLLTMLAPQDMIG